MTRDVQNYVRICSVCQACKYDRTTNLGLLQLLSIPTKVWKDISLDFIEELPKSWGETSHFYGSGQVE